MPADPADAIEETAFQNWSDDLSTPDPTSPSLLELASGPGGASPREGMYAIVGPGVALA